MFFFVCVVEIGELGGDDVERETVLSPLSVFFLRSCSYFRFEYNRCRFFLSYFTIRTVGDAAHWLHFFPPENRESRVFSGKKM